MPAPLKLYNTRTRMKEDFKPLHGNNVGVYCCGPTVYWFAHLGNLRTYICWDILVKTLRRFGYSVKHAMNITDVGHLSSDADEGEDKMIIAMKREGKSPWDIAKFYEEAFFRDCAALNIARPNIVCRATEHIAEMIEMIKTLEQNGYTYTVDGNVYFDTAKFPNYGELWGGKRTASAEHARVEVDSRKRNPADFVLWFTLSKFPNQVMKWPSPWGVGFPGWHIECSAMSAKYLGAQFDIHTGGPDHVAVHHTNEIAQSEGCFCHNHPEKRPWVNYWLHSEWLIRPSGDRMGKSKGNIATVPELKPQGIDPMAARLFMFGAHYRTQLAYSDEALKAAQNAYDGLKAKLQEWSTISAAASLGPRAQELKAKFDAALSDDLNTPVALACLWEAVKDGGLDVAQKKALLADFDNVLSLGLADVQKGSLSAEEQSLLDARAAARAAKDFKKSDELRDALAKLGIIVKDSKSGQEWTRR